MQYFIDTDWVIHYLSGRTEVAHRLQGALWRRRRPRGQTTDRLDQKGQHGFGAESLNGVIESLGAG